MKDQARLFYLFYQFLSQYGKKYDENTFYKRLDIFSDNLGYIESMNEKNHSFRLGTTFFADLTNEEYKQYYRGVNVSETTPCQKWQPRNGTVPSQWDWREKHVVTPVKDQKQCGSCWAFAATEVAESVYALKTGNLPVLAPQELVDCEKTSFGCSGGYPDNALLYITQHGLELESEYPYTAKDGTCKGKDTTYKLGDCFDVPPNDEKILQEAVSESPLVVLIEADKRVFQLYQSGVLSGRDCGQNLDHAVQLVGYGNENGMDYWLVRNSWGSGWGENGYIKIQRNSGLPGGVCGILKGPSGLTA